jgi:hypothetical protein
MSAAHVIEDAETSAGIVIQERAGFRFFAASRPYRRFDGHLFKTIRAAERAIDGVAAARG